MTAFSSSKRRNGDRVHSDGCPTQLARSGDATASLRKARLELMKQRTCKVKGAVWIRRKRGYSEARLASHTQEPNQKLLVLEEVTSLLSW